MNEEKVEKYILVEWAKVTPFYRAKTPYSGSKTLMMTEKEAYMLNRGLTMNGTGMRYVKKDNDTKK